MAELLHISSVDPFLDNTGSIFPLDLTKVSQILMSRLESIIGIDLMSRMMDDSFKCNFSDAGM